MGIAPLKWVLANLQYFINSIENEENVEKILMGLNFYGYDRTEGANEPILGNKLVFFIYQIIFLIF